MEQEQEQDEQPGDDLLEHTLRSAALVHYTDYLWDLYKLVHQRHAGRLDADTYLCPQSFRVALMAVGAVLDAIAAVRQPQHGSKLAFVACRPPGHHATRASGMGFCLLSNVAIGALQALRAAGPTAGDGGSGKHVERVGILDFDVHQGNGTENAVRGEPRVRFASLHEWPLYPMTGDDPQEHGPKRNLANFPLPAGTGWKNGYAERARGGSAVGVGRVRRAGQRSARSPGTARRGLRGDGAAAGETVRTGGAGGVLSRGRLRRERHRRGGGGHPERRARGAHRPGQTPGMHRWRPRYSLIRDCGPLRGASSGGHGWRQRPRIRGGWPRRAWPPATRRR
eukprot:ctg_769.g377